MPAPRRGDQGGAPGPRQAGDGGLETGPRFRPRVLVLPEPLKPMIPLETTMDTHKLQLKKSSDRWGPCLWYPLRGQLAGTKSKP